MDDFSFYLAIYYIYKHNNKQTNSVVLVRERTIPSCRRLSAKLVPTCADIGCWVISTLGSYDRSLGFLDRSLFHVAPQLYSRGCVDPVPDPLLLWKSSNAGNRTRGLWICSQELWPLDHRRSFYYIQTNSMALVCERTIPTKRPSPS
jgi:hypothetical protein